MLSCRFQQVLGIKVALFHGCFSRFLNCKNCTKLRNTPHLYWAALFAFIQVEGSLLPQYNVIGRFLSLTITNIGKDKFSTIHIEALILSIQKANDSCCNFAKETLE